MFFISIFTPFIVFLILAYQYIVVVKNEPEIKQKRNIDRFLDEFESHNSHNTDSNSHSLKNDIYRKALHIFPAAVILLLWVFAVYIWDGMWHADVIWGITGEQFGTFLIITAGYSGILVFAALDYVRLSYVFQQRKLFHLLPDNVSDLLSKSMKYNEIFEFTKSAAMVLAFTPIFFLPFGIFIAAALITTLGDAAASVIGIRYGTLHFPEHSPKTIRGFISGTIASFLIALCSFIIFLPSLSPLKIVLISTAGALTFLVTDIANLNIDDNMLNPLLCGAVMGIVYFIL
jgi:dolichol kinase